jgi:hypothetical protein
MSREITRIYRDNRTEHMRALCTNWQGLLLLHRTVNRVTNELSKLKLK